MTWPGRWWTSSPNAWKTTDHRSNRDRQPALPEETVIPLRKQLLDGARTRWGGACVAGGKAAQRLMAMSAMTLRSFSEGFETIQRVGMASSCRVTR